MLAAAVPDSASMAATNPGLPSMSAAAAADSASMATTVNAFGLDLYRSLAAAHPGEAIFFSPYSIATALGMAAEGARGETAAEMYAVLHLPAEEAARHAELAGFKRRFGELADTLAPRRIDATLDSLRAIASQLRRRVKVVRDSMIMAVGGVRDPQVSRRLRAESERLPAMQGDITARIKERLSRRAPTELSVVNALWVERTYPLAEPYVRSLDACYEPGSARPADFIGDPDAERIRINRWVEWATHARIADLLPDGAVSDLTRIVLANAMYFRGEWKQQFARALTKEADFFTADGRIVRVSMMADPHAEGVHYAAFHADGSLFDTPEKVRRGEIPARAYPDSGGFAMAEIPYREGKLSMVVIAPIRPDGLGAIEARCDVETLSRWIQSGRKRPVELYLPSFGARTGYKLNETLASMGMTSAFQSPEAAGGADFSGMNGSPEATPDLFISLVMHQAFIRVNEEGTEAAAATAVDVDRLGCTTEVEMMPFVPVFRADRPFLYLIRDVRTGVVLFLGRVVNPV
jgi:serine protease inhibitor